MVLHSVKSCNCKHSSLIVLLTRKIKLNFNKLLFFQTKKTQTVTKKFVVDCATPTENGVFDPESYVKYLVEHIKVDGHVGQLGELISVSTEGTDVVVVASTKFSGKYLKYLTKRYLKKNQIRDWIRFISVKKNEYKLQFYSTSVDEEEEDEE